MKVYILTNQSDTIERVLFDKVKAQKIVEQRKIDIENRRRLDPEFLELPAVKEHLSQLQHGVMTHVLSMSNIEIDKWFADRGVNNRFVSLLELTEMEVEDECDIL